MYPELLYIWALRLWNFTPRKKCGSLFPPLKPVLDSLKYNHVVSTGGVSTDPSKVVALRNWPIPRNVAELRSFLGQALYYRRLIKDSATIASSLHQLTQKGCAFHLTEDRATPFKRLQSALI